MNDCDHLLECVANYITFRSQYTNVLAHTPVISHDFFEMIDTFFDRAFIDLNRFQWNISELIQRWKKAQQASIISGKIDNSTIQVIEQYNTNLFKFILMVKEDLNKFLTNMSVLNNSAFKMKLLLRLDTITESMESLLKNAFIVIEQPCSSIMKYDPLTIISNAKFEVKLTLLIDHRMISNIGSIKIDIKLLKENELLIIQNHGLDELLKWKPSFNIINKSDPIFVFDASMVYISIVGMLKVDINRRGHNPKALPVAEAKFKFLFCTTLDIQGNQFSIHTFSSPVNVLSRKDYRNSYATIIWDNAFPIENRQMFETRDAVDWSELAAVLDAKFSKDVGVSLNNDQLKFIYTMIPNRNANDIVTWEQFAKICLPRRQFTFFEWFYKILILVREQLLNMYRDGLIHGFISSETAENMLNSCVDGTFLIRFSETYCGATSIAYIKDRKFCKIFPWDLERLRNISMAHTIKCTDFLLYLYPNYPKDEMFCKYYVLNENHPSVSGKDYNSDTNIAQVINEHTAAGLLNLFG